ncbi:MAG: hypothetical protein P8Z33_14115, partial [Gammaproteobacteria bacterium]
RKPVKHGGHFDLRALQRTKTALNDQQAFIAAGGILQSDRIVIGFQHPFPIITLRFAVSRCAETGMALVTALLGEAGMALT